MQSILDETDNRRTQEERINGAVNDCGTGYIRTRGCVHTRVRVFLARCLWLIVATINYDRGDNPGPEMLKV